MMTSAYSAAEHRFLSVLFCDMVGSTDYQFRMQPEEFETLLGAYRQIVFDLVEQHGGHVARVIGDGVLALFGWPRASGNDAQAAVICALEIGRRLQTRSPLAQGQPMAARMGIETGWVLVGEIGPSSRSEQDGVIGPAPNIAARLQRLARPNGVVVGEATLAQLSPRFLTETTDTHGIDLAHAISAAHVVGLSDRGGLPGRLRLARRTPLFGRADDLAWLQAGWSSLDGGAGRMLLLVGEPGIGKSRLLVALTDTVPVEEHAVIVLFCSRQGMVSPFHALIEPLAHDVGLGLDASGAEIEQRASAFAATLGGDREQASLALAALLGRPPTKEVLPSDMRSWTLRALSAWFHAKLARSRLVVLVEDVQWADASLGAFLRHLCDPAPPVGLFVVLTCHGGGEPEWLRDEPAGVLRRELHRLPPAQAAELTAALLPEHDSAGIADIVQRAEGVPLFIEELALSQGVAATLGSRLPGSVAQLLAARLDAVGPARGIAQLAGVVGQDAPAELLRTLSGLSEAVFESNVERLVESGIMARQGLGRACVLSFRHGMFGDAAYQALPTATRRRLHGQVADQLRQDQSSWTRAAPEVLGYHLERAGEHAEAASSFCRAATLALASGGYAEAVANARLSIQLANTEGDQDEQRTLLSAHIVLGEALIATHGESSSQVHGVYESATKIALGLKATRELLSPLRGLCAYYQTRGPLHRARELITWLLQLARNDQDTLLIADAERRLGWCLLCQGEIAASRSLLEGSVRRFVSAQPSSHAVAPIDTEILGLANLAILSWLCDGDEQARRRAVEVVQRAEVCGNPLAKAYGLGCAAMTFQMVRDFDAVTRAAARTKIVAEAHGITYWIAIAEILAGWAAAFAGSPDVGIGHLQAGLDRYKLVQGRILMPYALMLSAEVFAAAGMAHRAQDALEEATTVARAIGAYVFLPMLAATHGSLAAAGRHRGVRPVVLAGLSQADAQGAAALALALRSMLDRVPADAS